MENSYNRPTQLKRVRRPINRPLPQENLSEDSKISSLRQQNLKPSIPDSTDVEIDAYLDEPAVPVKRSAEKEYVRTSEERRPNYLDDETYQEEMYGPVSDAPAWLTVKVLALGLVVSLFIGVVAGKFLFAESKVVRNGLQGVVVNGEVPRGRARCGVAERAQGCVLYLMNPQRQELRAKDFYDLASQMTGRQRFMIETGNMRYANSKIKPGDIVQLNIPPL